MPTILPVPSPGALRTLRNLALGTSCTVAFSAGLLTEDRRRRIHAAREVHDNAQKLKSSRKYYSTGAAIIESFEEQSLKLKDKAYWLPSNVIRSRISIPIGSSENGDVHGATNTNASSSSRPRSRRKLVYGALPAIIPLRPPLIQVHTPPPTSRQGRLATDVAKLLDEDPLDLEAAASRFLETFEDPELRDHPNVERPLMDVAARLCIACRKGLPGYQAFKVFNQISRLGPMDEEDYFLFEPDFLISTLLKRKDVNGLVPVTRREWRIKKASSIYLTSFKEKPKFKSQRMLSLGEALCAKTCNLEWYELTVQLYSRMEKYRGESPPRAVQYLIRATHAIGHHKKMFRYFMKFFTKTTPNQSEFYQITGLVLDSLLQLGKIDEAEEVLNAAVPMAEAAQHSLSTTHLMKVLGHEWRTYRDILRTRALFDRLEPLCKLVRHPKAFYVAMVQFCVEAGEEVLATSYSEKLRTLHSIGPADSRLYGHFALAKAMRGDWPNLEKDLLLMRECSPDDHDTFGACFVPILRLYIDSHSIEQSEEFIRLYIEEYSLKPNSYIMNVMIDAYAKAKEVDSITRWISYASAQGVALGSDSFNTILSNLAYIWGFDFWEVCSVYRSTQSIDGSTAKFIDKSTLTILRRLATRDSPNPDELGLRLQWLNRSDVQPLKQLYSAQRTGLPKSATLLDPHGVYQSMKLSLLKGESARALHLYRYAERRKMPLGSRHLSLAVRSSLQLQTSGTSEAIRLIQEARQNGIDLSDAIAAVFVHQLTPMVNEGATELVEMNPANLIALATSTVEACERANIEISQSVMTHAASVLERKGYYRQSVDFCNFMTRRLNMPPSSFNVVTLTVLCKAYIGLKDSAGVQWAIEMIRLNQIVPDATLYARFKEVQREMTKKTQSEFCSFRVHQFLECVVQSREQLKGMRAEHQYDKDSVKGKVIQIIEGAIKEQTLLHQRSDVKQGNYPTIIGLERKTRLKGTLSDVEKSRDTREFQSETDRDIGHDIVVPPEKLVQAAA